MMLTLFSPFLTASRIRGLVASIPFEQFHKHSSEIIQTAAFGKDGKGRVRSELVFPANNLVSDSLSKSITRVFTLSVDVCPACWSGAVFFAM